MEFRQRPVEIEQQHKRGVGRASRDLGLHFRKHLTDRPFAIPAGRSYGTSHYLRRTIMPREVAERLH